MLIDRRPYTLLLSWMPQGVFYFFMFKFFLINSTSCQYKNRYANNRAQLIPMHGKSNRVFEDLISKKKKYKDVVYQILFGMTNRNLWDYMLWYKIPMPCYNIYFNVMLCYALVYVLTDLSRFDFYEMVVTI